MRINPLTWFILKIIVLLPACYWLWYMFGNFTTWMAADLTGHLLTSNHPQLIDAVEQQAKLLDIVTKISPPKQYTGGRQAADVIFSVNPLNYSFGLPLLMALVLSSPGNLLVMFKNILISLPFLLAVQIWGVYFASLKIIFVDLSPYLSATQQISQVQLDLIAIGYQLGTLILPAVTPLIIWIALYRKFITSIAPALYKFET